MTVINEPSWQQQLRDVITDLTELCRLLNLDPKHSSLAACAKFRLRVPRPFLDRMRKGDLNDPLLLQALPQSSELLTTQGFSADPLQENLFTPVPGLLHKYHGRVLLIASGACAINCRYCFRRHFPYQENPVNIDKVVNYIENDPSIYEVILSGGDPLILKDKQIEQIISRLAALSQLRYLRFHTRLPIMIPARITDKLASLLNNTRLKISFIIHCNHAQELGQDVAAALAKLKVQLFNQSVLLKNINDNPETLIALSHRLYELNIVPYYLHLLDPVLGTHHFAVAKETGQQLIQQVQAKLPGYLVPKLVCEIAGEENKTPM